MLFTELATLKLMNTIHIIFPLAVVPPSRALELYLDHYFPFVSVGVNHLEHALTSSNQ